MPSVNNNSPLDQFAGNADLVLAGGGVKGIGHVGALEVFEAWGYDKFRRVSGTSVGAIVGALVAAGLPAASIAMELENFDFREIRDPGLLDRVPAIGKPAGILLQHGIYAGDAVREWIHGLLVREGAETFGKLRLRAAERLEYKPRADTPPLVIFATDVTRGRLVRFPDDYPHYKRDPDKQSVADAVRASLSIPLFFEPVKLGGSLLVDGGVLSNYAIDAFDAEDPAKARWPTFGMTLLSENSTPVLGRDLARSILPGLRFVPQRLTGFLEDLIGAAIVGQDFHALSRAGVAQRTVQIDANAVGIVDFNISAGEKLALIRSGRKAAEKFLAQWDGDDGRAGSPRFPLPRKRSLRVVTA